MVIGAAWLQEGDMERKIGRKMNGGEGSEYCRVVRTVYAVVGEL